MYKNEIKSVLVNAKEIKLIALRGERGSGKMALLREVASERNMKFFLYGQMELDVIDRNEVLAVLADESNYVVFDDVDRHEQFLSNALELSNGAKATVVFASVHQAFHNMDLWGNRCLHLSLDKHPLDRNGFVIDAFGRIVPATGAPYEITIAEFKDEIQKVCGAGGIKFTEEE